jgi:hypothetical protein
VVAAVYQSLLEVTVPHHEIDQGATMRGYVSIGAGLSAVVTRKGVLVCCSQSVGMDALAAALPCQHISNTYVA